MFKYLALLCGLCLIGVIGLSYFVELEGADRTVLSVLAAVMLLSSAWSFRPRRIKKHAFVAWLEDNLGPVDMGVGDYKGNRISGATLLVQYMYVISLITV